MLWKFESNANDEFTLQRSINMVQMEQNASSKDDSAPSPQNQPQPDISFGCMVEHTGDRCRFQAIVESIAGGCTVRIRRYSILGERSRSAGPTESA